MGRKPREDDGPVPRRHDISSFLILLIFVSGFCSAVEDVMIVTCERPDLYRCDDTHCINATQKCNGISECESGKDESIAECGCPGLFQCNSTECIDMIRRCDISVDCEDGRDEEDCESFQCYSSHVKCDNHLCIPRDDLCDHKDDCGDNSDEANCEYRSCYATEWQCNNKQCVSASNICDGTDDCYDGTDEINCESHVLCDNGLYVSHNHSCDGWIDCQDSQTDELNCGDCDVATEYRCSNTRCISLANRCDGVCDCGTTCEDEKQCEVIPCLGDDVFVCIGRGDVRCIRSQYICDGRNDCHDGMRGSDEIFCAANGLEGQETCEGLFCPEGRCVEENTGRCDNVTHCIGGIDEGNCGFTPNNCPEDEFLCDDGRHCVHVEYRCDGNPDCRDLSDETHCGNYTCPERTRQCLSGQCLKESKWCDFHMDCFGGDDEENCGISVTCAETDFRCSNGQCIPLNEVCVRDLDEADEQHIGCRDGTHLLNCVEAACPSDGLYKCENSYCVPSSSVCDGRIDCKATLSDESQHNCSYVCPYISQACMCIGDTMDCTGQDLTTMPEVLPQEGLTRFQMSRNKLQLSNQSFPADMSRLTVLDISYNGITDLPPKMFAHLFRLQTLNLEHNSLTAFQNESFSGLYNLKHIYLRGNSIGRVQQGSFQGLSSLKALDLSHQHLRVIPERAFLGLISLYNLNISSNELEFVFDGAFYGLNQLILLDLSNNKLQQIGDNVFHGMQLNELYTDEFQFCCLARAAADQCWPPPNEFSSCEDLMSNVVLRMSVWVLGFVALLGNSVVIIWRIKDSRDSKVHSFLIANLAIGDMMMGIYLLMIAVVDFRFRGVYIVHDARWRHSVWCKLAGFLSTYSSELSVLTLLVITIDRFISIIFPFRLKRLGMREARIVMASLWLLVCALAAVPLMEVEYFENFYGRSGVCLALHITPEKTNGWEYSVFIFLVLNFVVLSIVFGSYLWMFKVARKTRQAARSPQMKTDTAMARRMTLIVLTDFFCWMPITLLGVASLSGAAIPQQVYAWIAVFILPLNAAINPLLYTLSTAQFMGHARRRAFKFRQSFMSSWAVGDTRTSTLLDDRYSSTTERFRYFSNAARKGEALPMSNVGKHQKNNGLSPPCRNDKRNSIDSRSVEVTYGYDSDQ